MQQNMPSKKVGQEIEKLKIGCQSGSSIVEFTMQPITNC